MILYSKHTFNNNRRVSVILSRMGIYFKLVEVLRILFDMCQHGYINETYITVFNEFPNTKYVTMEGLFTLTHMSPRRRVAVELEEWAKQLVLSVERSIHVAEFWL
ncbi:hypothetical protein [Diatraea saccharalis granulovirus]|uniref:Uncharacterized protein n=1 Tax=Diatraea saccharalis granulovirus TaxID=1675862 RepID=A0A0R7EYU0_9BBAC|nr:hypothetical protein [Diatraea saccharalis granulovirus]AKN80757.1 hypothetical protein [Diatraea saccharalis granulovirus]